MVQFDIIEYISTLAGNFVMDASLCKRIAMERGVLDVTDFSQLEQKQKDLLLADVLFTMYLSPNSSSSITQQHGAYSKTVGSQTINDKKGIYNTMIALYRKWDDEKLSSVEEGTVQWLE